MEKMFINLIGNYFYLLKGIIKVSPENTLGDLERTYGPNATPATASQVAEAIEVSHNSDDPGATERGKSLLSVEEEIKEEEPGNHGHPKGRKPERKRRKESRRRHGRGDIKAQQGQHHDSPYNLRR